MKLQESEQGTIIDILVKPNSRKFQVKIDDDTLAVYCREVPVKGRVNRELIKEFSRVFKKNIEILSGATSRYKKILIRDVTGEDIKKALP